MVIQNQLLLGTHGFGLMVSALDSGASGLGSSPGQGHCVAFLGKILYSHSVPGSSPGQGHRVVFLGKTLYSRSASLHPSV